MERRAAKVTNPHSSHEGFGLENVKCRSCGHAADAGVYCGSFAADIMAKALNPFCGGR